ncbi:MAG: serine/threonine protein kinase, partial [Acidobacteria bacterium]|nr:serine/threonine protein kinase [Acidobacteriota bacterium]
MNDGQPPRERTITRVVPHGTGESWAFELPDRWQIERFLGSGGQSEVWLAHDRVLGELVAVKVFHPGLSRDALERLRQEVKLGRSLSHPNLVRVFELIESDGRLAMAMEWLSGGSVAQRLAAGPLPIAEVLRIADETLAALAHLHERRIVHRDVKPSNLLLDGSGRVRLADLGLVRALDDAAHLTQTATAVGTPAYMSPEQIRAKPLSPATDLYALGVTLYHLITGRPPFSGASDLEVAHLHLQELPPDPRSSRTDCPPWLSRFVRRLLEKLPRDRWPDAAAALGALRRRSGLASPRVRRRVAVVAAVLASTVAVTGWGIRSGRLGAAPIAVSVQADGRVLRGLDGGGAALWAHECASQV